MGIYALLNEAQDSLIKEGVPQHLIRHAMIRVDNTLVLPRAYVFTARGEITVAGWWLRTAKRSEILRMLRHELGHIIARQRTVRDQFKITRDPPKLKKRWRQALAFFGVIKYAQVSREEWFCESVGSLDQAVMKPLVRTLR